MTISYFWWFASRFSWLVSVLSKFLASLPLFTVFFSFSFFVIRKQDYQRKSVKLVKSVFENDLIILQMYGEQMIYWRLFLLSGEEPDYSGQNQNSSRKKKNRLHLLRTLRKCNLNEGNTIKYRLCPFAVCPYLLIVLCFWPFYICFCLSFSSVFQPLLFLPLFLSP